MRRKLAVTFIILVACVCITLVALPWWLGVALGAAGERFGLTFRDYRRIGYTRFVLTEVEVVRPGVRVAASDIELRTPLAWFVKRPGEIKVGRWSVEPTPANDTSENPEDGDIPEEGWRPLRRQIEDIVAQLEQWLPPTTTGSGEIVWPGGSLTLERAKWNPSDRTRLQIDGLAWREHVADVRVGRAGESSSLSVEIEARDEAWDVNLESEDDGRISVNAHLWGQPVKVTARFGKSGWLPLDANVEATGWTLSAGRAGLGDFYETLRGDARIKWADEGFSIDVRGSGEPRSGDDAPPMNVWLQGRGDLDELSIERLDVSMPGVNGRLSEPVVLGRDGRLRSGASRFALEVELAKQPWIAGSGQITGEVNVVPQAEGLPRVSATLASNGLTVAEWTASNAAVEAELQWPLLRVASANVTLAGGDEVTLSGEANVRTRTLLESRVKGRVGRETAARWMTAEASFGSIEFDATASGTWPTIAHEGRAKAVRLLVPPMKLLSLEAEWAGEAATLSHVMVNATAKDTRVRVRGALETGAARVDEFVVTEGEAPRFKLTEPMRVKWTPSLVVEPFELEASDGKLTGALAWGESGAVRLFIERFESAWLGDLIELPGPEWSVETFSLSGAWDRGPLEFIVDATGSLAFDQGRRAEFVMSAKGDASGMHVETLRALMEDRVVVRAAGALPITVHPEQAPMMRIDDAAPLKIEAMTEPHAFFWEQLAVLTGLSIKDPQVRLTLSGTLSEPIGEATVRIAAVTGNKEGRLRALPDLTDLNGRLTADRRGVALETLELKAAGQTLRASGRLPVSQWAALVDDPVALAKAEGEVRIQIPDAEVAALAGYAPAYLAPTGTLQVDVALHPGGRLEGVLRLKDAASRPLGPLGSLQSISAEILLNERTVEFKEVSAKAGGQPVILAGTVELPVGKEPRVTLSLKGQKLPFVRQAGMLMRGDIDLRIISDERDRTRITGTARLRDSFFLMDVRALIPRGGPRSAPGRRPPYFAVDVLPFADWRLDVAVEGERFLRLRTPVFNGLASARFRLGGTLGDPRAIGEAVVNEGRVLLPFATFEVLQGEVRLTETNPYEPRVLLIGTSRRYGYDLRMELRGTAEKPELTFTSTPPLNSEQVLLMVMTGETPQNEVSYTGRERATRLGAYLGQSLLRQFGGDPEAADRLTISTGERISRQGRETYNAEYELTPRWSLIGEYDEFDEYNVGIKWRVFSEKKEKEEKDASE